MPTKTDNPNIRVLQKALDFKPSEIDGRRGPMTNAAIFMAADEGRLRVEPALVVIKNPESETGPEPIAALKGVHAVLSGIVMEAMKRSEVPFDVIEGLRSKERQAQLVKQGASKTHDSRHLTGHAVDLWPKDPATGKRLPSDAAFPRGSAQARQADAALWAGLRKIAATMKEVAREHGVLLEWGGDWGWDAPHFQLNRAAYPK